MPRTLPLLLVVIIAIGCGRSANPGFSTLNVGDYNGAAGYGRNIQYDGRRFMIIATSDFQGQKDKLIWMTELSPQERDFIEARLAAFPLSSLKDDYEDPDIWDGLQMGFDIRPAGKVGRSIGVANIFVEELAGLCDDLNTLLPPDQQLRYRQWKAAMDQDEAEMEREMAEAQAADAQSKPE